jgi:hypothetical protein
LNGKLASHDFFTVEIGANCAPVVVVELAVMAAAARFSAWLADSEELMKKAKSAPNMSRSMAETLILFISVGIGYL